MYVKCIQLSEKCAKLSNVSDGHSLADTPTLMLIHITKHSLDRRKVIGSAEQRSWS